MNGKKHSGKKCNPDKAIECLIKACKDGRPIVPLLGAGISVESGYPPTRIIVRYLAKVKYYLDNELYLPDQETRPGADTSTGARKRLRDQWLSRFGWPDPYQLNDDLWSSGRGPRNPLEMDRKIDEVYLEEWQQEAWELMDKLNNMSSVPPPNWRAFLRSVTGGRADHVDSLFQMLNRGRVPGNSHRFLAFLARLLNWKLILTTNFDDLIEKALRSEGLEPTVFDVWRQAELPNKELVEGGLSVVKLHGSAYGLRAGESLDDPLSVDEKTKLVAYMPENALLLVLGNGGADRRIMDLVEAVLEKESDPPQVVWMHFEDQPPSSVQELVQFEGNEGRNGSSSAEQKRNGSSSAEQKENEPNLYAARTRSAGAFLVGLHSKFTHVHPATANPYSAHLQQPLGVRTTDFFDEQRHAPPEGIPGISVHVFSGIEREKQEANIAYYPVDATSIAMSEFLAQNARTHLPIWIEAGMFQSVEEMISELMRQCRIHDSALPQVVLPARETGGGEDADELARSVGRVQATLRRGSYILAIDEISSFGRSPTTHHGLLRAGAKEIEKKVLRFYHFLEQLVKDSEHCGESLICLAVNDIAVRFHTPEQEVSAESDKAYKEIESKLKELRRNLVNKNGHYRRQVEVHECKGRRQQTMEDEIKGFESLKVEGLTGEDLENLRALVVSFRRPRSLVALQKLGSKYCRRGGLGTVRERIDGWLEELQKKRFLACLEGELYWMGTHLRDAVYCKFSKRVTQAKIKPATNPEAGLIVGEMATDLVRLIVIHKGISRYYYSDLFHPSKDISAYYEYLYHRITSLRYAARLAALLIARGEAALPPDPQTDLKDPVTEYLRALRQPSNDPAGKVLENQLNDIRALARTLDRDRDVILSRSSSNTLLGWFDWIIDEDLDKFLVTHYMERLELDLDSPTSKAIEDIEKEVRKLRRTLRNLQAKVLREKSDYDQCIRAWISQIHELLGLTNHQDRDGRSPGMRNEGLMQLAEQTKSNLDAVRDRGTDYSFLKGAVTAHEGPIRKLCRTDWDAGYSALMAWLEISDSLRFLGELDAASSVIQSLESLIKDAGDSLSSPQGGGNNQSAQPKQRGCDEQDENRSYLELRLCYGRAELCLAKTRERDNANVGSRDDLLEKAKEEVNKGLNVVREMRLAPDKYFIYRSLLHSLRGKVLAKQGRFLEAFREFDRAASGLDGRTGEGRYALAIRSLSMAEALTEHCRGTINDRLQTSGNDRSSQPSREDPESKRSQKAAHYLERAHRSLDDAEELLASGRRHIEAWRLLHLFRARVHLEGLRLALTRVPKPASPTEGSDFRTDESRNARPEPLGFAIFDQTRCGICAIRDAHDNLLVRSGPLGREDPRVSELRKLCKSFLQVCAQHECRRLGRPERFVEFVDRFSEWWESLVISAGVIDCCLRDWSSIRDQVGQAIEANLCESSGVSSPEESRPDDPVAPAVDLEGVASRNGR